MWRIQAQVVTEENGWTSSTGIPTFCLETSLLGLVNEAHVIEIAKRVIDPLGVAKEIHVSAIPLEDCM